MGKLQHHLYPTSLNYKKSGQLQPPRIERTSELWEPCLLLFKPLMIDETVILTSPHLANSKGWKDSNPWIFPGKAWDLYPQKIFRQTIAGY
eukprot:Gb_16960 [translate_table: standard]